MIDPLLGWILCTVVIVLIGGMTFIRYGAEAGMGVAVLLSFLAPFWLKLNLLGLPFDVRTAVASIFILAFLVRQPWRVISPITILDVLVAGLIIIHVLSDLRQGAIPVSTPLLAYGEWGLPYLVGRFAVRDGRSQNQLVVWAALVVAVLGIGAMYEAYSHINPWETIFGNRPVEDFRREAERFGFKRAFGPCRHPIFLGGLFLTLLPRPMAWVRWASSHVARFLAVLATAIGVAGIVSTVSRGPVLAAGLVLILPVAIWLSWTRWVLAGGVALLAVWIAMNPQQTIRVMEESGGDRVLESGVELEGESQDYSSTMSRILLVQAYAPALQNAGPLGYGSLALSTFPPNIPHLPAKAKTVERLRWVDNAYVLTGLRFGWLGLLLFVLLLATTIWSGLSMTGDRLVGALSGCIAASIIALIFLFATVWMPADYGRAVLWNCGIISGFASLRLEEARELRLPRSRR